ncbi:CapA family protein [Candidatus Saccharibacteria bacterium]|nr:CapA family protein [Candidatus Saccharibacteria bacterium]
MKIAKRFVFNKRMIIVLIIIGLAIVSGLAVWLIVINRQNKPSVITSDAPTKTVQSTPAPTETIIHMAAMGDMLAHDTINANAKTSSGYDYQQFFSNIKSIYKGDELVFCNQEGLSSGEAYGISGYPSFNAPQQFARDLQSVGCNMINLANNHMADKGTSAIATTVDLWGSLKPLAVSGANKSASDQEKVAYATVKGVKIGFISFADFNNNKSTPSYSVNLYHDEVLVRRLVTEARQNADVVIISMHWGVEDSNIVSSDQKSAVNLLSSLGVDVIIGTGPHVLQTVDVIDRPDGGKMTVWYSLGNMLSSQLALKELIGGVARFDITKTLATGKVVISNLTFTPTFMSYEWTASQAANNDLLARKNCMIYPLNSAADALSRSLFNTTASDQMKYVTDTIGNKVKIN